ncbi:hypothetical protein BDN70DRAFT_818235 [Pholiota conissans]|uniref:[histone H3]-trimethyl-L-lysine(9) demethylase n=1 Tax=Pholiota conissans TaxID=109636 RepID=A0A9P5YPJ3_9AGAR|nr:hypothetical protein BDN70DRAFT_818235 [Pholiota conissans]
MSSLSRGSTLTPCRSPTPSSIPVQPDHFYGSEHVQLPSPDSNGKTWLDPADDPLAHRGIPVFKPTMDEFQDFEGYMNRVECWGSRSGIVKVIPPKEWTASLPDIKPQLANVKIKTPIEQHMLGSAGLFRQENMEKRKLMSVREWVELCTKDEFRAPGVQDVGLSSRNMNTPIRTTTRPPRKAKQKADASTSEASKRAPLVIKEEPADDCHSLGAIPVHSAATPPNSEGTPPPTAGPNKTNKSKKKKAVVKQEPKPRPKRVGQTREAREASLAERAARDRTFLEVFDPSDEWLPPNTKAVDYTPEFCQKLERHYWRNCGLGKSAWYGADTLGSLFTDETTAWNVAHLQSALSRLLPSSSQGLPGVNTPYLYFGMWRATFAWHVEDMDLFSINYIHFGAPKFWYAVPQNRASALEQTMRGYFPKDTSQCPQFLRHKSFLASPTLLANSSCKPNHLVQQAGEFVITYPRGYHAGFNLGLNCAESVNFALDSWLELGRRAQVCECLSDSVRIDVDQLLREKAEEQEAALQANYATPTTKSMTGDSSRKSVVKREIQDDVMPPPPKGSSQKRKSDANFSKDKEDAAPRLKKIKIKHFPSLKAPGTTISIPASKAIPKLSVTLKLGPRPEEVEPFPCCLCVSMSRDCLLRVHEPPLNRKDALDAAGNPKEWFAHEDCASIVPETWVDEIDTHTGREKLVFGVDGIVKDRWNLKCSACTKSRLKAHGAPVQCTKGKCPKAFHVNCARDGHALGIVFAVVRDVEKEVVLLDPSPSSTHTGIDYRDHAAAQSSMAGFGSSRVLKIIKKLEVQILCTQHNPAVAAQKKALKHDKIHNELLALPSMSRIKIRVSAGVFEVSLVRVIEETCSVEVVWDRGMKREFKWGSVVFGNTDGPVQQKPSEILANEPEQQTPQPRAQSQQGPAARTSTDNLVTLNHQYVPIATQTQSMYAPHATTYGDYWAYPTTIQGQPQPQFPTSGQTPYGIAAQVSAYQFPYGGVYPNAPGAGQQQQQYNPYTSYAQAYTGNAAAAGTAPQYRGGMLNWQQPYQGPAQAAPGEGSAGDASDSGSASAGGMGAGQPPAPSQGAWPGQATSGTLPPQNYLEGLQMSASSTPSSGSLPPTSAPAVGAGPSQQSDSAPEVAPLSSLNLQQQQQAMKDLAALSSLDPAQIADILLGNPHLRDIVLAAVDQAKKVEAQS